MKSQIKIIAPESMSELRGPAEEYLNILDDLSIHSGSQPCETEERLPASYLPSKWDVMCGRSKKFYEHEGNRNFRQVIASKIRCYVIAKTKLDKSCVILSVMDSIKSQGGIFIRPDPRSCGGWRVVDEATTREKVGSSIRALIKEMGGEAEVVTQLNCESKNYESSSSNQTTYATLPQTEVEPTCSPIEASESKQSLPGRSGYECEDPNCPNVQNRAFNQVENIEIDHQSLLEDPLFEWIPPAVESVSLPMDTQQGSIAVNVGDSVVFEEWFSASLELDQEELNALLLD